MSRILSLDDVGGSATGPSMSDSVSNPNVRVFKVIDGNHIRRMKVDINQTTTLLAFQQLIIKTCNFSAERVAISFKGADNVEASVTSQVELERLLSLAANQAPPTATRISVRPLSRALSASISSQSSLPSHSNTSTPTHAPPSRPASVTALPSVSADAKHMPNISASGDQLKTLPPLTISAYPRATSPALPLSERSESPSAPGEPDGEVTMTPPVDTALQYIESIRVTFGSESVIYKRFLDVITEYKESPASENDRLDRVVHQIVTLFRSNPKFISGFSAFLPRESQNRLLVAAVEAIEPPARACVDCQTHTATIARLTAGLKRVSSQIATMRSDLAALRSSTLSLHDSVQTLPKQITDILNRNVIVPRTTTISNATQCEEAKTPTAHIASQCDQVLTTAVSIQSEPIPTNSTSCQSEVVPSTNSGIQCDPIPEEKASPISVKVNASSQCDPFDGEEKQSESGVGFVTHSASSPAPSVSPVSVHPRTAFAQTETKSSESMSSFAEPLSPTSKNDIDLPVLNPSGQLAGLESSKLDGEFDDVVALQASFTSMSPETLGLLQRLQEAGYTNRTFNAVLLQMHGNDYDKVLSSLKQYYKIQI